VRFRVPGAAQHEVVKMRDLFVLGDIYGLIARLKE
jgi:hypothetical protein